jgi:hypothetical protein
MMNLKNSHNHLAMEINSLDILCKEIIGSNLYSTVGFLGENPANIDACGKTIFPAMFGFRHPDSWVKNGLVEEKQVSAVLDKLEGAISAFLSKLTFETSGNVFLQFGDMCHTFKCLSRGHVLKVSSSRKDSSICVPYAVNETFKSLRFMPIEKAPYTVSFVGRCETRPKLRYAVLKVIEGFGRNLGLGRDTSNRENPTNPECTVQNNFNYSIDNAKFVVCPRGEGLGSIRFYETLCAGRIPIILADEGKLPLEDFLPYESFTVKVPEDSVEHLPRYIEEFMNKHCITEAARLAKSNYEQYFSNPTHSFRYDLARRINPK